MNLAKTRTDVKLRPADDGPADVSVRRAYHARESVRVCLGRHTPMSLLTYYNARVKDYRVRALTIQSEWQKVLPWGSVHG